VVFRAFVKAADALTVGIPGGPRGYQVLAAAAREDASSQSVLAQRLGIDRTVMTYLLDDLVQAGLVERRPDPADRRSRRVVLTSSGRAVLADLEQRLRHAEDHILADLPRAEQDTLRRLLRQLADRINARDPVANVCQVVEDLHDAGERHTRRSPRQ